MITAHPLAIITIAAAEPAQTLGSSSSGTTGLITVVAALIAAVAAIIAGRRFQGHRTHDA